MQNASSHFIKIEIEKDLTILKKLQVICFITISKQFVVIFF